MDRTMSRHRGIPAILLLAIALAALIAGGCRRESPAPQAASPSPPPSPVAPPAPVLRDVSESGPNYIVGISYPPTANKYPQLAAELKRYADAARSELKQALDGAGGEPPPAPYDLSLSFTQLAETPRIVAVAADGSSYTGGAHGNPLIARFVWLPQQGRMLTAAELIPDPAAWSAISDYAREQLHTGLSQRIDGDAGLDAADRAEMLRSAGRMIEEGTAPKPENFAQFEPVLASDGRVRALRFVFPPYQVGPYSDGTQTVEVPAEVLLPKVAPAYRELFVAPANTAIARTAQKPG
jgi:hypothetical protein